MGSGINYSFCTPAKFRFRCSCFPCSALCLCDRTRTATENNGCDFFKKSRQPNVTRNHIIMKVTFLKVLNNVFFFWSKVFVGGVLVQRFCSTIDYFQLFKTACLSGTSTEFRICRFVTYRLVLRSNIGSAQFRICSAATALQILDQIINFMVV